MKTFLTISILAILLVITPGKCFALWEVASVDKARAEQMGMEIRSEPSGPNHVRVELEFKIDGPLKNFTEGVLRNYSRVELRVGEGDNPPVTAPLREDRSKPGRIIVSFIADQAELAKISLWVMVAEPLGGTIYDLRMKDFVTPKDGH